MSGERREHPRHPASLVGEIELNEGRASVAITRDVSTTGLLIFSRSQLEIGTSVSIKVAFRQSVVMLDGKVVRREDVDPTLSSLWRYRIGLAISPSPEFEQILVELTELADKEPPAEGA
jgi:hypothetical protein